MKRALLAAALLVLAGCTSTAKETPQPEPTPPPFIGCGSLFTGKAELPDFALPCFTGGEQVSASKIVGPAVVNFWAPWCLPCGEELPSFQRLADSGQVKVIGVATDTNRSAAISLATELEVTMPTLLDPHGQLRRKIGDLRLPLTLFVGADGKVTSYAGPPLNDDTLGALVKQRLGVA